MKTAISIPDAIFEDGERLAGRLGWSRSQLYAEAMKAFLIDHADEHDAVTVALDTLYGDAAASLASNPGKDLIDSGQWDW
ncbi:MAG: ChpI protein [Microthrixaceae bacterium]|jgi:metal-responsive CopG/Arc/MetJ family transcriptional regulator|nr:ChpI protein [Microthrixaceae bacterium]